MYTIKQAASRSGVPVQLLRAWERRYGVVSPSRASTSGYRLYDDESIARLRAMRLLIGEGWAPSTAARHLEELDDEAVAQIVARSSPATPRASDERSDEDFAEAFVQAAASFDEPGVEKVLDEMFARGSFEQVATEHVMPALVALGQGWEAGRVDVAAEHAAAAAVQRRLGAAFMAAGVPRDHEPVLVGLPAGSRHELGALAFATAARRSGIAVRYLGPDLPVADWLGAVARTHARAAVIGVVISRDARSARDLATQLRAANPELLIAIGGRAAKSVGGEDLEPLLVLPDDLTAAVDALVAALGG